MSRKVKWGVLSTAKIGMKKVLPAMLRGEEVELYAIASRNSESAATAAAELGIPVSYGTYEELLADSQVEAIYNPLPNHLHVSWTIKALEAGKAVLCEKPLALTVEDAEKVIAVRNATGIPAGEAFMVASHPQWDRVRDAVGSGEIGELKAIHGIFSYNLTDPSNIRNVKEYGGGGIYDIGCYPIMTSRMVLGEEPRRVLALAEHDPESGIDRVASVILDFPSCQASFISATQMVPHQTMQFFGTKQHLQVDLPFNPLPNQESYLYFDGGDPRKADRRREVIAPCDHYTLQGDRFSRAVRDGAEVPVPLENSLAMAKIYEALFRSIEKGGWEKV